MRKQRRIVVLGFSLVGKTAICVRFCDDRFNEDYEPTYENSFHKSWRHKNQEIDLHITDSQGQDEQDIFRSEYCVGAHGYILVYSVTSRRSLDKLQAIHLKLINLMGHQNIPRILVANKIDLDADRNVSTADGQRVAAQWGCAFQECSAKNNQHIEGVFRQLLEEIDRFQHDEPAPSHTPTCCPWGMCGCLGNESSEENQRINDGQGSTSLWPAPLSQTAPQPPSHSHSHPHSSPAIASTAHTALLTLTCLTMLFGCLMTVLGLIALLQPTNNGSSNSNVYGYVWLGFGALTLVVSLLGCWGTRQRHKDLLRVYGGSLCVILVVEIVVCVLLLVYQPHLMMFSAQTHTTLLILLAVIGSLLQVVAVSVSCWYQWHVCEGGPSGSEADNDFQALA